MFNKTKLTFLALAVSATASIAQANDNTVSVGYASFSDIKQYSIKFDSKLSDVFVFTAAIRPHTENYRYHAYKMDSTITDSNMGMKILAPLSESAHLFFGVTLNHVSVTAEFDDGYYKEKVTGSDFGHAFLAGFEANLNPSSTLYSEFRHTQANGDEIDVKNNMLEIGARIHFNDSISMSVANIQGKVWNSRMNASDIGYDSALYVGLNFHF